MPIRFKSKSNHYFHYFSTLCDWFKKLLPSSIPIRFKTKSNHDFHRHTRFPALWAVRLPLLLSSLVKLSWNFTFLRLVNVVWCVWFYDTELNCPPWKLTNKRDIFRLSGKIFARDCWKACAWQKKKAKAWSIFLKATSILKWTRYHVCFAELCAAKVFIQAVHARISTIRFVIWGSIIGGFQWQAMNDYKQILTAI